MVLKRLIGVTSPLIAIVAVVSMVLTGCSQPGGELAQTWYVYQHDRYGLEFFNYVGGQYRIVESVE